MLVFLWPTPRRDGFENKNTISDMCKFKRTSWYCLSWLMLFSGAMSAQTADDFSDGDITSNPTWSGDLSHFLVNSSSILQLNAPSAGTSTLVVPLYVPDSAVWQIDVQLGFAPSSGNRLRVYLMADAPDLTMANGYFLEMGENGSADALKFFRQDAGSPVWLASGTPGLVAADTQACTLRVKRSGLGEWSVDYQPIGGPSYLSEMVLNDTTYSAGSNRFFGIWCTYTATRTTKFHFDNLRITEDLPDVQPPELTMVQVADEQTLSLAFNEPIDASNANDVERYLLLPQAAVPVDAVLQNDGKTVLLMFGTPLVTGIYGLQYDSIADLTGNFVGIQTISFEFIAIETCEEFDVLIHEIMADPTPSAGLPEVEWVELYNRSGKYLELSQLRLDDGTGQLVLPSRVLEPESFIVLASPTNTNLLSNAGIPALAVAGMPSLNNDGDLIRLSLVDGEIIDQVEYSSSWHDDNAKKDGGWSIERIDPVSPCLGATNWRSCPLPIGGGTPGAANAAQTVFSDTMPPLIQLVHMVSESQITLQFSEGLDRESATVEDIYRLEPWINITSAVLSNDDRSVVSLLLEQAIQPGIVYHLILEEGLSDCAGNKSMLPDSLVFGLPEKPEEGDVVVCEILFNPPSGGVDYLEFYNRSDKIFTWDGFFLDNTKDNQGAMAIQDNRLFLPGDYVVFCSGPTFVRENYNEVIALNVMQQTLPSLPDNEGNLTLLWSDGTVNVVVDAFDYDEDYHNVLLSSGDRDGVALERLNMHQPSNMASNWISAAKQSIGLSGTPTQPNSQKSSPMPGAKELLTMPINRLSPDGDGREDFLEIRYNTPASGYAASMTVFDSWGIPVRQLIRQTLIGTNGNLRWEGDDDAGSLVRPGIYVLFMEIFSPEGDVQKVKKTVAVVGKF